MQLFYSTNSPYARKCRVFVLEKGLQGSVEFINRFPLDNPIPADLLAANPLGRVPVLVTDEGMSLTESSVICDYLDSLAKPYLIPKEGMPRYMVLGIAALADGIMDAAVQCVLENRKPEGTRSEDWITRKIDSIKRTLNLLSQHPPEDDEPLSMATISLAVALSYISFRQPQLGWEQTYPALAAWHKMFSARPSMQQTQPVS